MSDEAFLAGRLVGGPASARLVIDGRPYINFYGSGYLALSSVPEIRAAVAQALEQGVPFAQPLPAALGGSDPVYEAMEREAAVTCGTQASIYFASGYLIGSILLASHEDPFDLVALDEYAHWSLRDAARLSGRPVFTYAHCDAGSLRELLRQQLRPQMRPLLLTDGVFATTGAIAPLAEYAQALEPYEGRMLIDESHGFGVVGDNGRGAAEYCRVEHLTAAGATLSKAFCAQGAIVGCSAATVRRLRSAPVIRGSNAGSPLSAIAARKSLEYVREHPELRSTVSALSACLRGRLCAIGVEVIDSPAPIVSFRVGGRADMLALQRRAFEHGIYLFYSNYIGAGAEGMIRCAVFRDHSHADLDALVDVLQSH